MFGDRKELILPLVLDIANLVRMAAESNDAAQQQRSGAYQQTLGEKLPTAEFLRSERDAQPRAPNSAMRDDRLSVDMNDEPEIMDTSEYNNNRNERRAFLVTRSAPFYDHLLKKMVPNLRSAMASNKPPVLQRRVDSGSPPKPPTNLPLNQNPFAVPSTPSSLPESTTIKTLANESYNEIEALALNGLNGSYVEGSDSVASETGVDPDNDDEDEEHLPTAEKLIGGRYRKKPSSRYTQRKPGYPSSSLCEKFTGSVCLRVEDYPM